MTLRPFTIATLIVAAIVAAAVPASAQKSQPRPPRPDWGIFASGVSNTEQRLVLTVNFGGGWEDDLSKAPPVDPELPTTPSYTGLFGSAGATLAYTVDKKSVQGGLQVGAYGRNYGDMSDPFVGTYSASGNLSFAIGERATLNTSYYVGQYLQNLAPMGTGSGMGLPGVPSVPNDPGAFGTGDTYRGFGASASYSHSLTAKLAITAAYSYYANDSWSSDTAKNPYDSQYVNAGLHYSLGKGLGLRAGYGTTIGGFGADGESTDFQSRNIDAGVDYNKSLSLSRRSTLSFNTGVSGVADQADQVHFYFVGGAHFNYEIGRSWNAYASVNRSTNFYQTLGQPTITNSLTGGLGGLIGRRVSVQADMSVYGGTAIGTSDNMYDSASANVGMRVALNRILAVGGNYFYYRYGFSDAVLNPPPGFQQQSSRQGVQVSLTVWAPLVTQARRANASGKKYTPEDIILILRKRIWLIVVPWAVIAAVTAGVARKLPDLYESTAWIQVVPPKVQTAVAAAAAPVPLDRRLQALQNMILTRTKLERLIQEFDLYKAERAKSKLMEEIVQNMRDDIRATPVKGDAFTIRYTGRNPTTVMKVTERLAGYFKDENARDSNERAAGTNSFVESQVEAAKRKLEDTEDKLTQYKLRHAGELPTQLGGNLQALQTINQNLNSIAQGLGAANTNKTMLERMIAAAEVQGDAVQPAPVADVATSTGTAVQRLALAKAQVSSLQLRGLLPTHPDVIYWQGLVATLTKEAETEALQNPVGSGAGVSPAEKARQAQLAGWRDDLERVKKEIVTYQAEEKRQRALAQTYQAKVDSVPTREAELVVLTRDYETLSTIYQGLVAQKEASSATVNLESRQMGEQFNLIEPARLPERPSSPNRMMINMFGLLGGLAVGLGLVALIEYRDTTFKTDSDLSRVLALPVLAVVPLMKSETERRADFRKQIFLNVGLGSAVFVCLAVLAYSFVVVK